MNLLKLHYKIIVLEDYLIKYQIKNLQKIPKFKEVFLSIKLGKEQKGSAYIFLKTLTFNKAYITQSKINSVALNIRKGDPVGIKLTLRRKAIYDFLIYFLFEILPLEEEFNGLKFHANSINWEIKNLFVLEETNSVYAFLKDLSSLSISIKGENLNSNFFLACRFPLESAVKKRIEEIKKILEESTINQENLDE